MRLEALFRKKIILFLGLAFPFFLSAAPEAFFSSDDKISTKLVQFIDGAQKRIYVAVYMLTDKRIAAALIDAKNNRDVDVQIVTDKQCLDSEYGKVELLKINGIDVFVYTQNIGSKKRRRYDALMHNKFALFDNKVLTGSFNWTISAGSKNLENVVCLDNETICKKYEKHFEELKRRCLKIGKAKYKTKLKKKKNKKVRKNTSHKLKNKILKNNLLKIFKEIKKEKQDLV